MKNKFWDKKIPTLLGMLMIILGLSFTTLLANKETFYQTRAEVNKQPLDVRITNITNSSFTVSYKTSSSMSGYINYGTENTLGQTAFDERDLSQKLQDHIVHSITIQNLNPLVKYYFSIISDGDTYLNNDNNFEITTAANTTNPSSNINDINGKIILPDASPPQEAIIYVKSDDSQVLSTLVKNDGTYNIRLTNLLSSDLSQTVDLNENSSMQILTTNSTLTSSVNFYYPQGKNLPTVTLSNNYDFRFQDQDVASISASLDGFPSFKDSTSSSKKIAVIEKIITETPIPEIISEPDSEPTTSEDPIESTQVLAPEIITPEENQTFSDTKPLLKGTALPNQSVEIIIHSDQKIQATVSTDDNGYWSYKPTTALTPGDHTITVKANDSNGILQTITQSFTVYAAEISPIPTNAEVDVVTTPIPTINSYASISATPTTIQSPLPATGNESVIIAGITGLIISFIGGLIFLFSRNNKAEL